MKNKNNQILKAVDFFCGGGGMSYGLRRAGINVLAGIDIDLLCKDTYEYNNPGSTFLHADITTLNLDYLEKKFNITQNDDKMIFVGCSPCQYWSIVNTNKTKSEKTKNLLFDFQRFIDHYNPGYVLVENVPGILKKKDESPLTDFLDFLDNNGYKGKYGNINLNEYGVPQSRRRFSLMYSRIDSLITFPEKVEKHPVVSDFIGVRNGFPKIDAGYKNESDFMHWTANLSEKNLIRLKQTPINGGTEKYWNDELKLASRIKKKIFTDVYGRMSWNKPAPTITTKFTSLSNGRFGHPEENRAISIREGATLQTFPKKYKFFGSSFGSVARMIGNAVPPEFAKKLGETIIQNYRLSLSQRK